MRIVATPIHLDLRPAMVAGIYADTLSPSLACNRIHIRFLVRMSIHLYPQHVQSCKASFAACCPPGADSYFPPKRILLSDGQPPTVVFTVLAQLHCPKANETEMEMQIYKTCQDKVNIFF